MTLLVRLQELLSLAIHSIQETRHNWLNNVDQKMVPRVAVSYVITYEHQELISRVPDLLDMRLDDCAPWSTLLQEQISHDHGTEGTRQFATASPTHQLLDVVHEVVTTDASDAFGGRGGVGRRCDLAVVPTLGDLLGKVTIQILNHSPNALFVAIVRLRILEEGIVVCAIHGGLDKGLERLADLQKVVPLFCGGGPRLTQLLQLLVAVSELGTDLFDDIGELLGNLVEENLAESAVELGDAKQVARELLPDAVREEALLIIVSFLQSGDALLGVHILENVPAEAELNLVVARQGSVEGLTVGAGYKCVGLCDDACSIWSRQ